MTYPDQQPRTGSIYIPGGQQPQQFGHPSTWQQNAAQPVAYPPAPPPARRPTSRLVVLVIVGVVVAVMAGLLVGVRLYNDSRGHADDATNAKLISTCHEGVKARLKAPSTAQFSEESIAGMTETRWKVSGVVDAQNGFGAMLRQRYSCQADKDGAGGWTVYNVAFTDW